MGSLKIDIEEIRHRYKFINLQLIDAEQFAFTEISKQIQEPEQCEEGKNSLIISRLWWNNITKDTYEKIQWQ